MKYNFLNIWRLAKIVVTLWCTKSQVRQTILAMFTEDKVTEIQDTIYEAGKGESEPPITCMGNIGVS